MCDYNIDVATVWDESRPRARRSHQCSECRHPIQPGHRYVRIGCLFDASWSTVRYHEDCDTLRRHINDTHCGGEPYAPDDLRGAVAEHYRDEPALLVRWARILRARRAELGSAPRKPL